MSDYSDAITPIKIIGIIADRAKCKKAVKLLNECGVFCQAAMPGRGTAPSDIQSYLGLGEPEKTVLFGIGSSAGVERVMKLLEQERQNGADRHGIAFSVNVQSVGSGKILDYLTRE